MSHPDRRLILSPKAEADFADILQYTLETWGDAQMLSYRAVIGDALKLLLTNPEAGFVKPEVSARHRFLVVGEHMIAYRLTGSVIEVSRIMHSRMNAGKHLK